MALTTPVAGFIVAIPVVPPDHVPAKILSVSVTVVPLHTATPPPVMTDGEAVKVTVVVPTPPGVQP